MQGDKVKLIIYVLFLFVYFYIWYDSLKKTIGKIEETDFPEVLLHEDEEDGHDNDDSSGHDDKVRIAIEVPVVMQVIAIVIYLAIVVLIFYGLTFFREGFAFKSKEEGNIFGFKLLFADLVMIATTAKICMVINDLYSTMLIDKSKSNEKDYVITQTIALYIANFFIFIFGFVFAHLFLHAS